MKLNLGSGTKLIDGYTNVDISNGDLVYPLSYEDNSIDEIRASHILEHFSHRETLKVLIEWNRVLKLNGVIKIAVPDFDYIINNLKDHPMFEGYIFGGHVDAYDFHYALFTQQKLTDLLWKAGFRNFTYWKSEIDDCASFDLSLNIQAVKSYSIFNTKKINQNER
jgi:predicted SAM-dependent methyltransferase